jgi:hypothetical protein
MKRLLTIFSVLILATAVSCSQSNNGKKNKKAAEIAFAESEHNFGEIAQGSEATYNFVFRNTGKSNLVIEKVNTTCGCTVPEWTREPVRRNKPGIITVHYNTAVMGQFVKAIKVYSNAITSPVTLTIKGTVVPKSEMSKK